MFIGLENINPDSLLGAKKRQNKITDYREMMLAWKKARIMTVGGYILGFPNDTPESIVRDIEIVKHELPIDMLEFFFLTPLPGSEDHKTLYMKGVAMDTDLNKYDLDHVTVDHPAMSKADWERACELAWNTYYSWEHIETLMRRAAAMGNKSARSGPTRFISKATIPSSGSIRSKGGCCGSRAATSGVRICRSSRPGRSIRAMPPRPS